MTEVVIVKPKTEVRIDRKTYQFLVSKKAFLAPAPSSNYEFKVEFITLEQSHIDARRVYQAAARNGNILFDVVGAPTQCEGLDYLAGSDYVDWAGGELQEILSVGDIVRLVYLAKV